MFQLAHLSDIHLAPLPWVNPLELSSKRLVGFHSWRFRRKAIHLRTIADAIVNDIQQARPDHVALTGDLINISLRREFRMAARWMQGFGNPGWITVVPGNHDAYVPVSWDEGLGLWGDYMTGDLSVPGARGTPALATPYPFVRQRRNVAMVGVSTALPTRPGRATGMLGPVQIESLARALADLRHRGFFRILLIHHPPLPGQCRKHKALTDAGDLATVLADEGCELVLHGHNHVASLVKSTSRHGPVNIVGVPSASSSGARATEPAAWKLYRVRRAGGRWDCAVSTRAWNPTSAKIEAQTSYHLDCG